MQEVPAIPTLEPRLSKRDAAWVKGEVENGVVMESYKYGHSTVTTWLDDEKKRTKHRITWWSWLLQYHHEVQLMTCTIRTMVTRGGEEYGDEDELNMYFPEWAFEQFSEATPTLEKEYIAASKYKKYSTTVLHGCSFIDCARALIVYKVPIPTNMAKYIEIVN